MDQGDFYGQAKQQKAWEILPIWLFITSALSAYDALRAYVPALSRPLMTTRYPTAPWQEQTGLATRQVGLSSLFLTVTRLHAGLSIHNYGAYNAGVCGAALMLVHYVSERMMGTVGGRSLSLAELVAFVTFCWMMVQREKYVQNDYSPYAPDSLWHPHEGQPFHPGIGMGGHV